MSYFFALVHGDQIDAIPALADLARETELIVQGGWVMRPPGLRDYINASYSTPNHESAAFLMGYYVRWLINEPGNRIILSDDLTYLLLFRPEFSYLSENPVTLERFRQDLINGFLGHEVANIAPRYRELMGLALRSHPDEDDRDIIKHHELIKDQWRDTPLEYWGPPFPDTYMV